MQKRSSTVEIFQNEETPLTTKCSKKPQIDSFYLVLDEQTMSHLEVSYLMIVLCNFLMKSFPSDQK